MYNKLKLVLYSAVFVYKRRNKLSKSTILHLGLTQS